MCTGRPIMQSGTGPDTRRGAQRINSVRFLRDDEKIAPDLIGCTHFLPADILSQLIARGRLPCPVWVQVTDFDLHRNWVHEHMAGYFAPNEEVAFRLREHRIARDQNHVTGIPITPAFRTSIIGMHVDANSGLCLTG